MMSTNHNLSLCMLTAFAIATIAAGFGTIDPLTTSKCGRRRMRQRTTGLWSLPEDDDADTVVSSNINTIDDDYERSSSKKMEDAENDDDRAGGLRKLMQSFSGIVGNSDGDDGMRVGSTVVVSGLSLPNLGIEDWQSYELVSVYDQGIGDNGLPVKIYRQDLNEARQTIPNGYKRYCTLYSERYHKKSGPVVVSPDEIQLVSVKDEVKDSLLMALPVFGFWTALAVSFSNLYNERYGGNFLDALFRT